MLAWLALRLLMPAELATTTYAITDLDSPSIRHQSDLTFDRATSTATAAGNRPTFLLAARSDSTGIREVRLRLRPLRTFDFFAFRAATPTPAEIADDELGWDTFREVSRGVARVDGESVSIAFFLPTALARCRIELPRTSAFRLDEIAVIETDRDKHDIGRILTAAGLAGALSLAASLLWPGIRLTEKRLRSLLRGFITCSGFALLFLLPPFQGPDEWKHWKMALALWRPDAEQEIALFNLPETLDALRVPYRAEEQFGAARLNALPAATGQERARWHVGYATWLSYPAVGLVSLIFPHVVTISQALTFFYLCRALPLFALVWLLRRADQAGLLGLTALTLFSSPLFLQQTVVITADTLPNLGTIAAAILFARCWREPTTRRVSALAAVCIATVLAKPPVYAPLLLLPQFFVPWRRIAHPRIVGGLLVLSVGAVLTMLTWLMPQYVPAFESVGKCQAFVAGCGELVTRFNWLTGWFGPLGWLDTIPTGRHQALIAASVIAAILYDLTLAIPLLRKANGFGVAGPWLLVALAANALFVFLSLCAIMYVVESEPGLPLIRGVQMRYLFPPLLLILLLPLSLFTPKEAPPSLRPRWPEAAAMGVIPMLFFARQVECACELLVRYW